MTQIVSIDLKITAEEDHHSSDRGECGVEFHVDMLMLFDVYSFIFLL